MNIREFDDRGKLMSDLAVAVAADLDAKIKQQGWASLAVPGGTTPGPFFDALSETDLDWANVSISLGDERFVPETSDRSNTALIKARLLQNKAADANLIRLYKEAQNPEDVLDELEAPFKSVLPLSVNVLGMGADMHTASLFPDSAELEGALNTDRILSVVRPDSQPEARLTLSGKVLAGADHIYILITGEEKRKALEQAARIADPLIAPISLVLDLPQTTVFYAE